MTPHQDSPIRRRDARFAWGTAGLFLLLVLARVPFFAAHHIQEDAFITWRCARSLLQTGVYGFNPGERVSASTSHAYVLLTAGVMWLAGDWFMPLLLTLNTAMLLIGTGLICKTVVDATIERPWRRRSFLWSWALVSLLPASLLASYGGMETALLILLTGLAVHGLLGGNGERSRYAIGAASLFLLPWTRPDAVALAGLLLAFTWWKARRFPLLPVTGLAAGTIATAAFNKFHFGTVLNQTIIAKTVAYRPVHTLASFISGLKMVVGREITAGLYLPLHSGRLFLLVLPVIPVVLVVVALYARTLVVGDARRAAVVYWLIAASVLPPIAYAAGGVIFPWYLWPAEIFLLIVLTTAVIAALNRFRAIWRRAGLAAVVSVVVFLAATQECVALNTGTEEYGYRADVGRYMNRVSQPNDTLFLEPAGYIPYFADRYTWDEVGLGAPEVTAFQRRYGPDWWFEFLRQMQPTYTIQRGDFIDRRALYGGGRLDADEQRWFDDHYELVRAFRYDPADYWHAPLMLKIVCFRDADRYGVYRLRALSKIK